MAKLDLDDWNALDKRKFLLYGGAFTVAVDFLIYPLELVKTRVQVEAKSRATLIEASVRSFRGVLATEGARGLWRGFPLFTIGGMPSQGAYFFGYNWMHHKLSQQQLGLPLWAEDGIAGFFADVVASPLWTPTEVVATRMQIQGPGVIKYDSTAHAFRHIVATEGVQGLFRGLSVSILAFGPASALWWALYQQTHRQLTEWTEGGAAVPTRRQGRDASAEPAQKRVWIDALSGLISGSTTSVVTNPLDIAKTRLQTQHALLSEYELAPAVARPLPARGELRRPQGAPSTGGLVTGTAAVSSSLEQDPRAGSARSRALEVRNREEQRSAAHAREGGTSGAQAASSSASSGRRLRALPAAAGGVGATHFIRMSAHAATTAAAGIFERSVRAASGVLQRGPTALPPAPASSSRAVHGVLPVKGGAGQGAFAAPPAALVSPSVVPVGGVGALPGPPFNSALAPLSTSVEEALRCTLKDMTADGKIPLKGRGTAASAATLLAPHGAAPVSVPAPQAPVPPPEQYGAARPFPGASTRQAGARPVLHKGLVSVMVHIVRTDGPGALIRGLVPRMLMQGPASAATFVAYEQVKRLSKKDDVD